MTQYQEIYRLIPREPKIEVTLDLSLQESNAVQWANAYYHQLFSEIEIVNPVETNEKIVKLCEQIQDLIPVVDPIDPTDEFMKIYGNNEKMCRTHNYFNRKIGELLKEEYTLIRKKTMPVESEIDLEMLDQLARDIYIGPSNHN